MARQPKSAAGPRTSVTIRLPLKHLEFLDSEAKRTECSRSDLVIKLIERLKGWQP